MVVTVQICKANAHPRVTPLEMWLTIGHAFRSCFKPPFQSEAKREADFFYSHANKAHFYNKSLALGLVLKVRGLYLGNGYYYPRDICYGKWIRGICDDIPNSKATLPSQHFQSASKIRRGQPNFNYRLGWVLPAKFRAETIKRSPFRLIWSVSGTAESFMLLH